MVRDVRGAAYTKWVAVIGREPKPMTANYEQAVIDHVIDLLEEHSRPIALIEIIPGPLYLLIENIAVPPDRDGEGIGGVFFMHACRSCRERGTVNAIHRAAGRQARVDGAPTSQKYPGAHSSLGPACTGRD